MTSFKKSVFALAISGVSVGGFTTSALAQQLALEEVVVTAQKREESLQDTPIAISAFTSENLEQIGAFGAIDVGEYTPNAVITRSLGSTANIRVSIRGRGTAEPSLAVDPKVGVYLDGAYIARNAGAVFDVVDLERVEVLRGPQGTLFGRNPTGGAILFRSNTPHDQFASSIRATLGNNDLTEFQGFLNVPVNDTLMLRLAGISNDYDGDANNNFDGSDANKTDTYSGRLSVR